MEPFLAAKNDPALRARLNLAPEDFVIGTIARLFKLKGHDDLIDIAAELIRRCPRVKILFVGDGAWRERLQNRVHTLGLDRHFVFAGLVRPEEVPGYVGIMDLLVHLSRREGLARALPQAMTAGRPVVACDCDGAAEVCIDDQTGYLVRPGDGAALLDRLLLLAGNPSLRARLGAAGCEFVRDRFPVEKMVESLRELYEKLGAKLPG